MLQLYKVTDESTIQELTELARNSRGHTWWGAYRNVVSSSMANCSAMRLQPPTLGHSIPCSSLVCFTRMTMLSSSGGRVSRTSRHEGS